MAKNSKEAGSQPHPGALVIIGGAKDKEGDCRILAEFIRLAGGPRARIVVLAVALDMLHEAAAR